ncbi:unnamed protein product [Effrenium voratum]|nr:unnamed protein product [Effrenium voratum]
MPFDLNTFRKNLPDFLIPKVKDWLLEAKSLMNPPPPVVLLPDLVMLDPSLGPDTTATRTMPDNFAPDHTAPDHTAPDPTEPDGTQPDRPEPDTTMREDTMPEAPEKTPDQVVKETLASLAPSLAWAADQLNLGLLALVQHSDRGLSFALELVPSMTREVTDAEHRRWKYPSTVVAAHVRDRMKELRCSRCVCS